MNIQIRRQLKFRIWHNATMHILSIEDILGDNLQVLQYEPVMQYTGMRDKDRRDIYEGDIVKGHINEHYQASSAVIEWQGHGWLAGGVGLCTYNWDVEIIGNIYENPELLDK